MKLRASLIALAAIAFALAACAPAATPEPTATTAPPTATASPPPPSPTPPPTGTPAPTDTPTPIPTPTLPPLPPEPQRVEFQAKDGATLVGYYYPAAVKPAPVVVLMHWAGGDQQDWVKVGLVQWLQNRGGGGGLFMPMRQVSLYPPMPEGLSFAVFTFDFRGFGESGGPKNQFLPQGWLQDAQAAIETAKTLPDVDPERIATMGASIGADGAVDACAGGCLGALAFSPGDYLEVSFSEAVTAADAEGKPVWCLAAEGDDWSTRACNSAAGDHYRKVIYPGEDHGMMLFHPGLDPDIGQTILDFLLLAFGITP